MPVVRFVDKGPSDETEPYTVVAESAEPVPEFQNAGDVVTQREDGLFEVTGSVSGFEDRWRLEGVVAFSVDPNIKVSPSLESLKPEEEAGEADGFTPPELSPPDNAEICTTIPLSWANAIPGVSGVQDAQICIPTPQQIAYEVGQFLLDELEVFENIQDIAEDVFDDLPAPEITVDEGLFGDVIDNLEEAIQEVVEENIPELPDIADDVETILDDLDSLAEDVGEEVTGPLEELREDVETVVAFVESLPDPSEVNLQERALTLLQDLEEDVPGLGLLLDPEQFIDEQIDRLIDRVIDDDDRQAIQEFKETFE